MRVFVVANPRAGRRALDPREVDRLVGPIAASAGAACRVLMSRGAGGGRESAREALQGGADLVIAWGGDGTINEVASQLAGTRVPLGIVPSGSGNGLARALSIPLQPMRALEVALGRRTRLIDVASLNDRPFVNIAGVGLDAQIARRFNANVGTRGFARYLFLTLSEVFRYEPQHYTVQWNGGVFEGPALMIVLANSREYGNGVCIAPMAEPDDGVIDLIVVRPSTPIRSLWRALRLFNGSLARDRGIECARVGWATIQSEAPLTGHVDGELIEHTPALDVSVRPGALVVCVPASGAEG